jgi:HAMP domain-containing protein
MTVGVYGVVAIGALAFALQLPVHSPVAREMIVAHQIAGGAPAQEMTAPVFSKNG